MDLTLIRQPEGDGAIAGDLFVGETALMTLELPWRNNLPDASCVPLGKYDLIPYNSPAHGPTWCLENTELKVMGCDILSTDQIARGYRSMVELHAANWSTQLLGCIALGLDDQPMLDPATGIVEPAIEDSRDAVAFLVAQLGVLSTGHTLAIQDAPG
jgi:Family of unknown function (DUF5675)